jgi:hypothetical protein
MKRDVNNPLAIIKPRQRAWAVRNARALDKKGYCDCVDANLFGGLSESAQKEFGKGGWQELR